MKKKMLMICAMVSVFAFTACGKNAENTEVTPEVKNEEVTETIENVIDELVESVTENETKPEEEEGTLVFATVMSSDGTEVTLETEPMTVVSCAPGITEMIYSLGAEDKLIARTDYCDYPEAVFDIPSIGDIYPVNVEAIVELNPDLVVASTHFSEEDEKALTDAGVKVLVLYEEHDVKGVYSMYDALGKALNKEAEAKNVVQEMKTTMATVSAAVGAEDAVSVYYVVGYGEWGDYTAGGDTFINDILTLAGGDNIAADVEGWSYSVEALVEEDPYVIIVPAYALDDFCSMAPYCDLTAVKEGRVIAVDNNMLDRQCDRNAEAVSIIAEALHPSCF